MALQVRLPDDLHAEIKQLTEQDDRPLNRTVIRLLRSGLAAESEYKALRQAVSLLNSMVECGEKHSDQSRSVVQAVLDR